MKKNLDNLRKTIIFKDFTNYQLENLFSTIPYIINKYNKDQIIAVEGDNCESLGVILSGNIEIHKPFPSGRIVTISNFQAGNIFGEATIFSEFNKYPATIISSTESQIMYIDKQSFITLMKKEDYIFDNFIKLLSNRILMLNDRITNLSYDTVRKKIANIILIEYSKQKNRHLILPFCRKKMAQLLNIPRPSLSRELMNMKEEKIIDYQRNKLKILDIKALDDILLK